MITASAKNKFKTDNRTKNFGLTEFNLKKSVLNQT